MSLVTLAHSAGRAEVLALELVLPLRGPWTARVEIGEDAAPIGAVVIDIGAPRGEPGLFRGVVRHGGAWQGRSELSMVGGAGGLGRESPLPGREYVTGTHPVTVAQLVDDIASATRETLAPAILSDLAGLTITRWMRVEGPGAKALGMIADHFQLGWRVLADGALWVGPERWTVAEEEPFRSRELAAARVIETRPEGATLRPGVVLWGRRIDQVIYRVDSNGLTAEVTFQATP